MKKNLLLGLLVAGSSMFGQAIFHEPFDYTVGESLFGQTLDGSSWDRASSNTDGDMTITAEPGWGSFGTPASTGNAVTYSGGGEDMRYAFTQVSSGTIYYSALIQVNGYNDPAAHDPYRQIHLTNDGDNDGASLYFDGVDGSTTTFQIGVQGANVDAEAEFITTPFNLGEQYLVVVSYNLDDGNGTTKLWVNPVVSATEPTADITHTPADRIRTNFVNLTLEASSNARTPDMIVDEIRVATSWVDAVPVGATASTSDVFASKFSVFPNPANGILNISGTNADLKSVQLFNTLGKQVYASQNTSSIDVSGLSQGLYLLKLNGVDATGIKKVIIE